MSQLAIYTIFLFSLMIIFVNIGCENTKQDKQDYNRSNTEINDQQSKNVCPHGNDEETCVYCKRIVQQEY